MPIDLSDCPAQGKGYLGKEVINGTEVDVYVSSDGTFRIKYGEQRLGAGDTLTGAKSAARRELNKTKAKIRFHFRLRSGERMLATGMHSGMNKVIVYRGAATQVEYFDQHSRVYKSDTPDEVFTRLIDLGKERAKVDQQIKDLENEHSITLGQEVRKEVDEEASRMTALASEMET